MARQHRSAIGFTDAGQEKRITVRVEVVVEQVRRHRRTSGACHPVKYSCRWAILVLGQRQDLYLHESRCLSIIAIVNCVSEAHGSRCARRCELHGVRARGNRDRRKIPAVEDLDITHQDDVAVGVAVVGQHVDHHTATEPGRGLIVLSGRRIVFAGHVSLVGFG